MSTTHSILIIDDEENIRKIIAFQLSQDGIVSEQARSAEEAYDLLKKKSYSCIISDIRMPGDDGLAVLEFAKQNCPDTPLILLTAHGSIDLAVSALKKGAFDFLCKPYDQNELIRCVRSAQSTYELENPHPRPSSPAMQTHTREFVGQSTHYQETLRFIEQAAEGPSHLIITGEMGTGKELVARNIHESSPLHAHPFIRLHCGAVPQDSLEGELFGFEKGAHPTLLSGKPGKIELADGGTLLIEEIQLLPASLQVRLLETLQTKTVERIGAISPRKSHVRVIATSRKPLHPQKEIRDDLALTLNVMNINILPLREHLDDLEPILRHLLKTLNTKLKKAVKDVDPEVIQFFHRYSWPGNVRELVNILERMMVRCQGFILQLKDVPEDIQIRVEEGPNLDEATLQADRIIEDANQAAKMGGLKDIVRNATQKLEKSLIIETLKSTNGNVTHAAKKLEISRKSLQNKMKEFSLREKHGPHAQA